ncbi:hypothetical protein Tco_1183248 [Tanacetum coccineum]
MIKRCSWSCDEGILVEGVSWLMEIDTGESANTSALGAAASGTGETIIVGGLKSHIQSTIGQAVMTEKKMMEIAVALDPQGLLSMVFVFHLSGKWFACVEALR